MFFFHNKTALAGLSAEKNPLAKQICVPGVAEWRCGTLPTRYTARARTSMRRI
jgi:hypothetical protein